MEDFLEVCSPPIANFARVIKQIAEKTAKLPQKQSSASKRNCLIVRPYKIPYLQEENKMAKLTTAEFIDAIKELSVLELNDLVKSL